MVKQCQSCGMPLQNKKTGNCRGTETDDSKRKKWQRLLNALDGKKAATDPGALEA